ncbi:envelope glycoprotein C [Ateline alphaherpesvirus 1]|uniref:Envelope glycoprotein C n=1 Tax=Herpesvirus ateles type 1 (strain Lennette) TaxID=35243 RepID=A0A1S6JLL6_HSVA1|nr:envelope glycoprotein C [Ateline alphaherpesvirus 1]AQS79172.1 envelope glycoprotein C [Ateline alphaherpesvirus 1]
MRPGAVALLALLCACGALGRPARGAGGRGGGDAPVRARWAALPGTTAGSTPAAAEATTTGGLNVTLGATGEGTTEGGEAAGTTLPAPSKNPEGAEDGDDDNEGEDEDEDEDEGDDTEAEPTSPPPTPPRRPGVVECDHAYMQARVGTRLRIPCRVRDGTAASPRTRIWKYPLEADADAQYRRLAARPGEVQAGAELVYDSGPAGPPAGARWAPGAGPDAHPRVYDLTVHKARWRLSIVGVELEHQGVYQWLYGDPVAGGDLVRITAFSPPRVSLVADTVLEGAAPRAVCSAAGYYPGDGARFEWFEDGDRVPDDDERVVTRVFRRPGAVGSASTLTSGRPGIAGVDREFACLFVWRRDDVSYTRTRLEATARVLPRPHIQVRLDGNGAVCEAACVPRNVTIVWRHEGARAADAGEAEDLGGCASHPGTHRIRSVRQLVPGQCTYSCGLAGYPPSVEAPERSATLDPCGTQTSPNPVIRTLEVAGATAATLSVVVLAIFAGLRCAFGG